MGYVGQQPAREVLSFDRCGRARLGDETASWNRLAAAMGMALKTTRARSEQPS